MGRARKPRPRRSKGKRSHYYRRAMARLRDEWGGKCQCIGCASCSGGCGIATGLEFAHVRPTGLRGRGRGLPQRYHDVKRNPDAYRLLCDLCHLEFDRDLARALASAPLQTESDTEAA
jgi:hypothetical protein